MGKQPGQDHGFEVAPNHVLSFSWAPEAGAKEEASPRHLLDSPAGTKYGDHSPSWWTWMVLKVQGSRKPLGPGHTRTAGHPVWHRACRMSPGAVVHPPSVAY